MERGSEQTGTPRPRPALLRALGRAEPPEVIEIDGLSYRRVDVFKHDSWAATALYAAGTRRIICKFDRQQSILGLPMRWLGRRLAARERFFLERLADLNVPAALGPVTAQGRLVPYAVAHEFIPGHALRLGEWVPDTFFPQLARTLAEIHRRGLAYVDLHKRENILVGDDGQPYLIDFQISYAHPQGWWARLWPSRSWLRCLQLSDDYHLLKHYARHRGDQAGVDTLELKRRLPWWLRLHRWFAIPFRALRRRVLVLIGVRSGVGHATSEAAPEIGLRPAGAPSAADPRNAA